MSWRRGLFRTWLVLSAIWVLYWLIAAWHANFWLIPQYGPLTVDEVKSIETGESWWARAREGILIALLPPPAVLGIGAGLFWAALGFRRQNTE